jgi:hypothetical protein
MIGKEFARLEAILDKRDPSRIAIDISLRAPNPLGDRPDFGYIFGGLCHAEVILPSLRRLGSFIDDRNQLRWVPFPA